MMKELAGIDHKSDNLSVSSVHNVNARRTSLIQKVSKISVHV